MASSLLQVASLESALVKKSGAVERERFSKTLPVARMDS
jgi:hypothetical protein